MDVTINVAGTGMDGQLHLPEGAAPIPRCFSMSGLTRDIAGLGVIRDALLKAGFAVLAIRYRGMDLLDDDEDVVAALDHLTAHESIDADRIAMAGHSRGSMVGLRTRREGYAGEGRRGHPPGHRLPRLCPGDPDLRLPPDSTPWSHGSAVPTPTSTRRRTRTQRSATPTGSRSRPPDRGYGRHALARASLGPDA